MPRETVTVGQPVETHVGWHPQGTVQIGLVPLGAKPGEEGMWTDLSRSEVNRFIQVLRRARDRAYGRDE